MLLLAFNLYKVLSYHLLVESLMGALCVAKNVRNSFVYERLQNTVNFETIGCAVT